MVLSVSGTAREAEDARAAADEALRAHRVHIRMSDDGEHGPRFEYPDSVFPGGFDEYVQAVDEDRESCPGAAVDCPALARRVHRGVAIPAVCFGR